MASKIEKTNIVVIQPFSEIINAGFEFFLRRV